MSMEQVGNNAEIAEVLTEDISSPINASFDAQLHAAVASISDEIFNLLTPVFPNEQRGEVEPVRRGGKGLRDIIDDLESESAGKRIRKLPTEAERNDVHRLKIQKLFGSDDESDANSSKVDSSIKTIVTQSNIVVAEASATVSSPVVDRTSSSLPPATSKDPCDDISQLKTALKSLVTKKCLNAKEVKRNDANIVKFAANKKRAATKLARLDAERVRLDKERVRLDKERARAKHDVALFNKKHQREVALREENLSSLSIVNGTLSELKEILAGEEDLN